MLLVTTLDLVWAYMIVGSGFEDEGRNSQFFVEIFIRYGMPLLMAVDPL